MEFPAPDRIATDPIVGWRYWLLDFNFDPPVLRSSFFTKEFVWPSCRRFTATCVGYHPVAHPSPKLSCSCGIFACETKDQARKAARNRIQLYNAQIPVWGEVSLWGRVLDHEEGWRGQHGYPLSLRLPQDLPPYPEKGGCFPRRSGLLIDYDPMAVSVKVRSLYGVEVTAEDP